MQTIPRARVLLGLLLLVVSVCLLIFAFLPPERVIETQPVAPQQIPWVLPAGAQPA